jgi:hypothetical protein
MLGNMRSSTSNRSKLTSQRTSCGMGYGTCRYRRYPYPGWQWLKYLPWIVQDAPRFLLGQRDTEPSGHPEPAVKVLIYD